VVNTCDLITCAGLRESGDQLRGLRVYSTSSSLQHSRGMIA